MDPPRKPERDEPDGMFSNSFLIGFNAYTFIFDFGMVDASSATHIHSRIVTSPAHAQEFNDLLTETLREHVKKFGPLKRDPKDERLHRYSSRD